MGAPSRQNGCVFCDIIARKASAHVVYEDAAVLAFLDIFPFTRGHTLVVPKAHVDRLTDLPASQYTPVFAGLSAVCRLVEKLTRDYNVGVNQGPLAGQIVFHLHFHVIPRYGRGNPFLEGGRARLTDDEGTQVVRALTGPPS